MAERRNFARKSGFRDSCLLIIAPEGKVTEKKYFEGLRAIYPNSRIHLEVLDREYTDSDPLAVMKLLDNFCMHYKFRKGYDQLWLVIDVDKWGADKLSQVCGLCFQKKYEVAISNPCFEIWLLLHLRSLDSYTLEEQRMLFENRKSHNRTQLEKELLHVIGSFNKGNPDMILFGPLVKQAIKHARQVDTNPHDRWPNYLGSRVYLLAEMIVP